MHSSVQTVLASAAATAAGGAAAGAVSAALDICFFVHIMPLCCSSPSGSNSASSNGYDDTTSAAAAGGREGEDAMRLVTWLLQVAAQVCESGMHVRGRAFAGVVVHCLQVQTIPTDNPSLIV